MQRIERSWLGLGLFAGVLSMSLGVSCVKTSDDGDDNGTGKGGSAQQTNTGNSTGLTSGTTTGNNTGITAKGGAGSTGIGAGGVTGNTSNANGATGNVQACQGVPIDSTQINAGIDACNGASVEAEPLPVDMIILMDRSISNAYAIGSEEAKPAPTGALTRWNVLTAAMEGLATDPTAAELGASITFFNLNGGSDVAGNCDAQAYATPVVPLGLLGVTGPQIVAAMRALKPSGLTPTVPALTGAFLYAMAEKKKDPTREKVVVVISDGFPTLCDQKAPSDVVNVIKEAAAAPVPIKTFVIGIGSPNTLDGAKFNLQNYARAGNTGKPPFVMDETAGADAVKSQLITTLLNISASNLACDYEIAAPSPDWVINPDEVKFTYTPSVGSAQEIPKVGNAGSCSRSANGGWYFDNPSSPKKISVCPCTCSMFGAGKATVVYGCKPNIIIE
ncbi:MAG TPA: vWA domain-containing protein [Polyangiaceae bacterium]